MPDPETPVPRDGRFLVDGQPHEAFMNITVNGEITVCSEGATLLDLILRLGLSPEKIVVERTRARRDVCRNRPAGRRLA